MSFVPLRDRVCLRRVEQVKKESPFIDPETAKQKPTECEVVAISTGYMSEYGIRFLPPVKVGQRVLIGKYSGSEHKVDGEELLFVRWDELLAVEPKPATPVQFEGLISDSQALQTKLTYGGIPRELNDYTTPIPAQLATKEEVKAKMRAELDFAARGESHPPVESDADLSDKQRAEELTEKFLRKHGKGGE
jgi:chaperonin GroES